MISSSIFNAQKNLKDLIKKPTHKCTKTAQLSPLLSYNCNKLKLRPPTLCVTKSPKGPNNCS